jgi:hypothetical protein
MLNMAHDIALAVQGRMADECTGPGIPNVPRLALSCPGAVCSAPWGLQ